ncbi:MAG: response regulator [Actinobacteria bacterium]|nr:response regulator [Actinomycetota bacterium]
MTRRILIADDEAGIRLVLATHLRRRGWHVDEAVDGTEALDRLEHEEYDAVVLDHRMPGLTGIEVARTTNCEPLTFIFSAYVDRDLETEATELGCASVAKTDMEELLRQLDEVLGATT